MAQIIPRPADGEPLDEQTVAEASIAHDERFAAEHRHHGPYDAGAREDDFGALGLQSGDLAALLGGPAAV
jgi:hypothetical protein